LHLVMRGSGNEIEMAAFAGDGRQVTAATAQRK
jgi:3-methylfumaryl-CoA hydratase